MAMTSIDKRIMAYILDNWHKNFTGTSASAISEEFGLAHQDVLKILDNLESKGLGIQNKNVKLYTPIIKPEFKNLFKDKEILTAIFFPSKKSLEKDIKSWCNIFSVK
ncbi:MAG: MarR family transcriptional regulator [Anaerolineae bacterium]|nr:MarR family transcriptional regulator [Anaerolineae bacterium]